MNNSGAGLFVRVRNEKESGPLYAPFVFIWAWIKISPATFCRSGTKPTKAQSIQ